MVIKFKKHYIGFNHICLDSSDLDSSSYDDMSEEGDEDFDDEELMIRTRTPHVSESLS